VPNNDDAPLVEVIFEIRWGKTDNELDFNFDEEEITLFAGQFRSESKAKFPFYKKVNEQASLLSPFMVKHQFWSAESKWPCIQIGLGILTVNLDNEDYDWELFKDTCIEALSFLDNTHHLGLSELSVIGVELRYQDAYLLKKDQPDDDFVRNTTQITFDLPEGLLDSDMLSPVVKNHHMEFSVPVTDPVGVLISKLDKGLVNGEPGFIQNTVLRSVDANCPVSNIDVFSEWLEAAHAVQQHVYQKLILPTHRKAK